jgi:trans-aconitate methyltransferase
MVTGLLAQESPQAPLYQEWNAYQFHRHTKKSLPLAKKLLQKIPLEKFELVLDVGCGPGALTAFIARNMPKGQVVGIDPSGNMIRFARGRYEKHKNLFFVQEDMNNTSLSGKPDLIFWGNSFQYLSKEDQIKALKTMAQISDQNKPTLVFMIIAGKTLAPEAFARAYGAAIAKEQWKKLQAINLDDYFQPHNEQSFAQLAKDTGFRVNKTEMVDEHIVFKNVNKLRKFIKSWMTGFGFIAALPVDERKQLLKDIMSNYVKEVQPTANGSIEWKSARFAVLAERAKN